MLDPLAELEEAARVAEEELTAAEDHALQFGRVAAKAIAATKMTLAAINKPFPPTKWLDGTATEAYHTACEEWKAEYTQAESICMKLTEDVL